MVIGNPEVRRIIVETLRLPIDMNAGGCRFIDYHRARVTNQIS
jgi:hypothetical protein